MYCLPFRRRFLGLLSLPVFAACAGDSLGPHSEGTPLLPAFTYGQWLWSRDGSEIIYLTYPYARTPAIVGAVNVTSRAQRTLASSPAGSVRRVMNRGSAESRGLEVVLSADGSHVYYLSSDAPQHHEVPQGVQLHRVRIDGAAASAPELVARDVGFDGYAVSSDMTRIAWNHGTEVRLLDLASGQTTVISTGGGYGVVPDSWAPDDRSILLMQNRPGSFGRGFAWVDLVTGQTREWLAPAAAEWSWAIRWFGGSPVLLATNTDGTALLRCEIAAATCATVAAVAGSNRSSGTGWSDDGSRALFWRSRCVKHEPNTFWGGTYCTRYSNDLRLLDMPHGGERSVLTVTTDGGGGDVPVFAPGGNRMAYTAGYVDRPASHGLFVRPLP
jgi:hypothetical protein